MKLNFLDIVSPLSPSVVLVGLSLFLQTLLAAHSHDNKPVATGTMSENGAYVVSEWPNFEGVELSTTHVAGNVYMIQRPGGGGNIGMYVGDQGVLLVDSLYPSLGERVIAEVAKTTDKPIDYVINTHIHIDHIGGNAPLAAAGATILAHDSVHERMQKPLRWPRHHGSLGPMPPREARPLITFGKDLNFHFEEDIEIFHVDAAHTDGDVFVYFPKSNVLHLGDVFRTTSYPVIDVYNGGSVKGTIQALEKAIALADSNTKIIPGHGLEIADRDELIEFRDMIATVRKRILAMIEEGMILDVVMDKKPTADFDAKWGKEAGWTTVDFIPIVFHELGGDARYRTSE